MVSPLKKEFDWYLAHQADIVAKHIGKYVVIKDAAVQGAYDSEGEAIAKAQEKYTLGTFLVQKVEPGTGGYTQTFHSRVAFS
jgi:hypothetical protein